MPQRINFLLSQAEKFDKNGNPTEALKDIFDYHITLGEQQIYAKDAKYRKLENLAHGKINREDYIKENMPNELEFSLDDAAIDDAGLNFYPIIPNIRNAILGDYDKKYIKYSAKAVNSENTNEIMEAMNQQLQSVLVKRAEELFLADTPNPTEEEYKMFQETEEVKQIFQTNYRTKIEKWANHTIKKEDLKYDMEHVGRSILDQLIITDDPVVHVNYMEEDYFPEVLNEKNCFYLKSTEADCYSESLMFGWVDYINIGTVINKYADKLDADQIVYIENWINTYHGQGFTINGRYDELTGNRTQDADSTQNWLTFKNLSQGGSRHNEYNQELFREINVYLLLPRKVGKLTFKSGDTFFKDVVDETFTVTYKPVYEKGYPKSEATLIEGEHVEWFYINELYKAKKLDLNNSSFNFTSSSTASNSIWIECKKHDIQYSDLKHKYAVSIPIYGGSTSNRYNESFSLVEKCSSWQIFYNWIWNRNAQLLATEVGRFFAFNQMVIPSESMDESWGKNNWFKWALTGRDTGFAPLDLSLSTMGQSAMQLSGGLGQMVDLNRTPDILEKAQLANIVKQECYNLVGLTPEFIFGDMSPKQTATSVMQGMQRSSNQIQHLYTRLHQILRRLRVGMLETAQFIEASSPYSQISYLTEDATRVIFNTNTEGFLLHKLDIYINSSLSDIDTLEKIKQFTLQNNTMGADSLEMATIQMATSTSELMDKLGELKYQKEQEMAKQQQAEQEAQNKELQFRQQQQAESIEHEKIENALDRQNKLDVAATKAIGDSNDDANIIHDEIKEMLRERNALDRQEQEMELKRRLQEMKDKQLDNRISTDQNAASLNEKIKLKQLEQKDKELELRSKDIIARNKRTKAID